MISLIKLESYQSLWSYINIPDAVAIYIIPNHLPYPVGMASMFEAMLGKPRFIDWKYERYYRKSYWDMGVSGDWAIVPHPRGPMLVSIIDGSHHTFPSAGIVVLWSVEKLAVAKLLIAEI